MPFCAVKHCSTSSMAPSFIRDHITFHRFPREPEYKDLWILASDRGPEWQPTITSTLCSRHFTDDCFILSYGPRLREDAVPTLCLNNESCTTEKDSQQPAPDPNQPRVLYRTPAKNKLFRCIFELSARIQAKNRKMRQLRESNRVLKMKVASLRSFISEMQENRINDVRLNWGS